MKDHGGYESLLGLSCGPCNVVENAQSFHVFYDTHIIQA